LGRLIGHRVALDHILSAYGTVGHAAETSAPKVIIEA